MLDLDQSRADRAAAAAREGRGVGLPIKVGGTVVATLPVEFPLDVLEPLRVIDFDDLPMLFREAYDAATGDATRTEEAGLLLLDLLVSRPGLPANLFGAAVQVAKNLLGEEGFAALAASRLSRQDVAAIIAAAARHFGVSLGESSRSTDSPESDGPLSSAISSGSTDSTPGAPSAPPETPTSSEPAA